MSQEAAPVFRIRSVRMSGREIGVFERCSVSRGLRALIVDVLVRATICLRHKLQKIPHRRIRAAWFPRGLCHLTVDYEVNGLVGDT